MGKLGRVKLRIVFPVARWLEDKLGRAKFEDIARASGLDPIAMDEGDAWAATEDVAAFLEAAKSQMPDEGAFRRACGYRLKEAYGPLRYIFWALSPSRVYQRAARNMHLVTTSGRYTIVEQGRGYQRWRYESDDRHESRCLCVLRQVNAEEMPTLWGLPPARVEEAGCVARGDAACEYAVRWSPEQRSWPTILGGVLGAGAGAGLMAVGAATWPAALFTLVAGLALGQLAAVRRQRRGASRFVRESHHALEDVAREEAEARQQLLELGKRQDEWTVLMERQLAERNLALEKVVSTVRRLQEERVTALRGYSHDLRSPLTIMRMVVDILKTTPAGKTPDLSLLEEQADAVRRMDRILGDLMTSVIEETASPMLEPERVAIETLSSRIRGQLRALVFGKDIRVSVFCTREAPDSFETDRLHFARIVDNLLSNAAKYTERGSIVVELDGRPEQLVMKLSDSGRGIAEDAIEQVFRPHGSDERARAEASYGLGLSVVVRLLAQLGGRLEVMSREGVGTTFWIYLPLRLQGGEVEREEEAPALAEVVTIRRAE